MTQEHPKAEQRLVSALRQICAQLPAAEEYVMVHHPAFRVGKKPFVIAGLRSTDRGVGLSVNLGPELQHQLLDDPRFSKTPYIGRHGWVTIAHDDVPQAELVALVRESFLRVANAKQRAQLAQLEPAPVKRIEARPRVPAPKGRAARSPAAQKPRPRA